MSLIRLTFEIETFVNSGESPLLSNPTAISYEVTGDNEEQVNQAIDEMAETAKKVVKLNLLTQKPDKNNEK